MSMHTFCTCFHFNMTRSWLKVINGGWNELGEEILPWKLTILCALFRIVSVSNFGEKVKQRHRCPNALNRATFSKNHIMKAHHVNILKSPSLHSSCSRAYHKNKIEILTCCAFELCGIFGGGFLLGFWWGWGQNQWKCHWFL